MGNADKVGASTDMTSTVLGVSAAGRVSPGPSVRTSVGSLSSMEVTAGSSARVTIDGRSDATDDVTVGEADGEGAPAGRSR